MTRASCRCGAPACLICADLATGKPSLFLDMTFSPWRERLPVRSHLRPRSWRMQVPPGHPEACALLFGQIDRAAHPLGWGYDCIGAVALVDAQAVAWRAQA